MGNCGTCHWISRDGRCLNNRAPHGLNRDYMSANDSCSYYMMNEEQEHQRWLASPEGKRFQAEEKRKKEEKERKEKEAANDGRS